MGRTTQHAGLIERDREQTQLRSVIAGTAQGAGRLVVVEGTAGLGKTHLLAAARAQAEQLGFRVLSARGLELEREFAYGLVRQLFEPVLAQSNAAEQAQLLAGAARQAAVLLGDDWTVPPAWAGGDGSFAILHGLFWLTVNLCELGPLVLAVDDLHWADEPSLRFLAHLLPRLDGLPLLVLVALRPAEPAAEEGLTGQITTDPSATLMRLAPLTCDGSSQLVRSALQGEVEQEFCTACHRATCGNPLLLHELLRAAATEGLEPSAAHAFRLAELAPQAVGRRVALRLSRLGPRVVALCRAVAVLGEAELTQAAALAGLDPAEALETARELSAMEIFRPVRAGASPEALGFAHPLVRAAVYSGLPEVDRAGGHAHAARLLAEQGVAHERVVAHLLRIPATGDPWVVQALRRAAQEAFMRGSAEAAVTYLERCLIEPLASAERAEILVQLGTVAQLVNMAKAAEHLSAALRLVHQPVQRAMIVETLGRALLFGGRTEEAVRLYCEAIDGLTDDHGDLRKRLEAGLISVGLADPSQQHLAVEHVDRLREFPPGEGLGSSMLDATIAFQDGLAGVASGDPVARARRALADGLIIEQANGGEAFACGCYVLMAADLDEVMQVFEDSLAQAHRRGSILAFTTAKAFRARAWLWRGSLAEAEADAREVMQTTSAGRFDIGRPFVSAVLADTLMERGLYDEAGAALQWASDPQNEPSHAGPLYWLHESRARLFLLQGQLREGLDALLDCGKHFPGWINPAFVSWRSDAAIALAELGRLAEARDLATRDLEVARRWSAPRALGRALRVAALVAGDDAGLALLEEALEILGCSPARLEHAKTSIALGARLRRLGRRAVSRPHLERGVELAEVCGAAPLAERGRRELRGLGSRTRWPPLSGAAALTPSEHRVVALAIAGESNRDIAQKLFITMKTVEAHLTRAYRKLGVTSRAELRKTDVGPPEF